MDSTREAVTAELARTLARYAALPLAAGREAAIAPILDAWLRDANALSVKMSAAHLMGLVPVTVFTHPDSQDGEA